MRPGSARSWSRRRSAAPRMAPRGSASCRWTSARRRWSPRSTTRRASGSMTCPASPERILAALTAEEVPAVTAPLQGQRRHRRARPAGRPPPARCPARGPRPDRHEGRLWRRRVRRLHGPPRRRGRRLVPGADQPGRRPRGPNGRGPRASPAERRASRPCSTTSTCSSWPSSRPAGPSAGSARRAC